MAHVDSRQLRSMQLGLSADPDGLGQQSEEIEQRIWRLWDRAPEPRMSWTDIGPFCPLQLAASSRSDRGVTAAAILAAMSKTVSCAVSKPARSGRMPLYCLTSAKVTLCSTGI